MKTIILIFTLAFVLVHNSRSLALPVMDFDGVQWIYQTKNDVHYVGDLHGNLVGFKTILKNLKLIDSEDRWIGGQSHLVLVGDYLGYGKQSKDLLDFIIDLRAKAEEAGGQVHPLLGNHEFIVAKGNFSYLSDEEKRGFIGEEDLSAISKGELKARLGEQLGGQSKYARFFRSLNSFIIINNTLVSHAGFNHWAKDTDLGAINATVRRWIENRQILFQDGGEPPLPYPTLETEWVVLADGPLFTSGLRVPPEGIVEERKHLSKQEFDDTLKSMGERYGVKLDYVVAGHDVTNNGLITYDPYYGRKLVRIDTGISEFFKNGSLSALSQLNSGQIRVWEQSRMSSCLRHYSHGN